MSLLEKQADCPNCFDDIQFIRFSDAQTLSDVTTAHGYAQVQRLPSPGLFVVTMDQPFYFGAAGGCAFLDYTGEFEQIISLEDGVTPDLISRVDAAMVPFEQ